MPQKLDPNVIAKVAILFQMGLSCQEIGNALGRCKSDIKDIIDRHTSVGSDRSHQETVIERSSIELKKQKHEILPKKKGFIKEERDAFMERFGDKKFRGYVLAKYSYQKHGAKRRGISWFFTPESWWKVWEESGKWSERGPKGYMMCRIKDIGPYAPWNVYIGTGKDNGKDRRLDLKRERDQELDSLTKKIG